MNILIQAGADVKKTTIKVRSKIVVKIFILFKCFSHIKARPFNYSCSGIDAIKMCGVKTKIFLTPILTFYVMLLVNK